MKKTWKTLLCLVLAVLLAAAVLSLSGCIDSVHPVPSEAELNASGSEQETAASSESAAPATESAPADTEEPGPTELGEGARWFYFEVTMSDGETASFEIRTDAETVGKALLEQDLIAGEDSQYGLYVKTVLEQTLDYDTDGMYWAFYENGEYALTGVDSTSITDGATYAFIATAG